jgi:putative membrane protein
MEFIGALINATVFSALGVVVFGIGFWISDKLTPVDLWKGIIEEKNVALAIVAASIAISIGMIVASAVHG